MPTTNEGVYVGVEPAQVNRYMDTKGVCYNTRDAALEASFNVEVEDAVNLLVRNNSSDTTDHLFRKFIHHYPGLVRVLLADFDYTGGELR